MGSNEEVCPRELLWEARAVDVDADAAVDGVADVEEEGRHGWMGAG